MIETQMKPRDCRRVPDVEKVLEGLGMTPTSTRRDGMSYCTLPQGGGWCQTLPVPEEAWPPTATHCEVVRWHPDKAYRRSRTGHVPAGAEAHWKFRTSEIVERLRALGFQAAITGPHRVPSLHAHQDILVWQQPHDRLWPPTYAWLGSEPATPHFGQQPAASAEREALLRVEGVLKRAARQWPFLRGTLSAQPALAVWWPPYAETCVRVLWKPTTPYVRRPDGALPPEAERHFGRGIPRVRKALTAASYRVREPERPRTPEDEYAGFLAWRSPRQPG